MKQKDAEELKPRHESVEELVLFLQGLRITRKPTTHNSLEG